MGSGLKVQKVPSTLTNNISSKTCADSRFCWNPPPAAQDAGWLRRQFHYYVGRWISHLWVGAIKLSAAERQITCICHLHWLKFLPYIFMAHCSRALSPSLRCTPTPVWTGAVHSLSFSDLKYQVSFRSIGCRCTARQHHRSYRSLAKLVLP